MYIDLEYLKEQCDGQKEMMVLMLDTFLETSPEYMENIEKDLKSGDLEDLRYSSHAFLSSLRILGSTEIGNSIAEIEDKCVNGDRDGLEPLVNETLAKSKIALDQAQSALENLNS